MKSSAHSLRDDLTPAFLSYVFLGLAQVLFSFLLSGWAVALIAAPAVVSALMARAHKGRSFQQANAMARGSAEAQSLFTRRRTHLMVICATLMGLTAYIAPITPGPGMALALASTVCYALAAGFAMMDTSESSPLSGPDKGV